MSVSAPKFLIITDNTSYVIGGPRYIGPYRIASELENAGIETFVVDRFYRFADFFDFLRQFLTEDFVGIGLSTTFLTPPSFLQTFDRYSSRAKRSSSYYNTGIISADADKRKAWFVELKEIMTELAPKAKLFIGGAKAQFFYHGMYDDLSEIDYVVMGVVDKIFPEVLKDLMAGQEPRHKMMGNKRVIDTAKHYVQPKVCPPHVWKKHWFVQQNEALPIEIGRGCAFNCKFCNYDKRENLRKTLDDLKQEFISNYENYGVQQYHFVDDCFNDSRAKVEEVCNLLLSLPFKVEWASYLRFDLAIKFPETADLIVESGGRAFHWGVESLTYEVARRAGKGTHSDKVKEFIVDFAKKHKGLCYSTGSFISGLPGETEESWKSQFEWLLKSETFDFIQVGPLGIAPYRQEFDGSVIDYADYSRNPGKYGFEKMDIQSGYWKHETMDSVHAQELSDWAMAKWKEKINHREGISTDIWIYPMLRSMGYTQSEVSELYFNTSKERQEELKQRGAKIFLDRDKEYFANLWSLTKPNGHSFQPRPHA